MSSSFRFKASHANLSTKEIGALRRISPYSIAEIQRRAASQQSLLDIPVFSGEWPASKATVVSLLDGIEESCLPLEVYTVDIQASSQEAEELLSVEQARQYLQFLREIALEEGIE
jgi:hypothetical protein